MARLLDTDIATHDGQIAPLRGKKSETGAPSNTPGQRPSASSAARSTSPPPTPPSSTPSTTVRAAATSGATTRQASSDCVWWSSASRDGAPAAAKRLEGHRFRDIKIAGAKAVHNGNKHLSNSGHSAQSAVPAGESHLFDGVKIKGNGETFRMNGDRHGGGDAFEALFW